MAISKIYLPLVIFSTIFIQGGYYGEWPCGIFFVVIFNWFFKENTKTLFIRHYFIAQSLLLCYQCVSTHPGCGSSFKWLWYKTVSCPEEDDICVKVIEKIGGNY